MQAAGGLVARDLELVARVAGDRGQLAARVAWLAAAPTLRKQWRRAVREHNAALEDPARSAKMGIFTLPSPIDSSLAFPSGMAEVMEAGRRGCPPFSPVDTACDVRCLSYFYWREIRDLCQGRDHLRPASYDQDTRCSLLTMDDPYLRLGPFLLEHRNKAGNYIAQVSTTTTTTTTAVTTTTTNTTTATTTTTSPRCTTW